MSNVAIWLVLILVVAAPLVFLYIKGLMEETDHDEFGGGYT